MRSPCASSEEICSLISTWGIRFSARYQRTGRQKKNLELSRSELAPGRLMKSWFQRDRLEVQSISCTARNLYEYWQQRIQNWRKNKGETSEPSGEWQQITTLLPCLIQFIHHLLGTYYRPGPGLVPEIKPRIRQRPWPVSSSTSFVLEASYSFELEFKGLSSHSIRKRMNILTYLLVYT